MIHGKGLVATQRFRVDEVVILFGGTLFSKENIVAGKADSRTLMQVDEDLWLGEPIGRPLGAGNFINHFCDPNLWITDEVTNLTARREINPGEEVTMDYATLLRGLGMDHVTHSYTIPLFFNPTGVVTATKPVS